MIYTGNILKADTGQFDEVWVICRAVEELEDMFHTYKNVKHVLALAPSEELFKYYRNLVHLGEWDKKHFDENYVPQFLNDLQNNEEAKKYFMNWLISVHKSLYYLPAPAQKNGYATGQLCKTK